MSNGSTDNVWAVVLGPVRSGKTSLWASADGSPNTYVRVAILKVNKPVNFVSLSADLQSQYQFFSTTSAATGGKQVIGPPPYTVTLNASGDVESVVSGVTASDMPEKIEGNLSVPVTVTNNYSKGAAVFGTPSTGSSFVWKRWEHLDVRANTTLPAVPPNQTATYPAVVYRHIAVVPQNASINYMFSAPSMCNNEVPCTVDNIDPEYIYDEDLSVLALVGGSLDVLVDSDGNVTFTPNYHPPECKACPEGYCGADKCGGTTTCKCPSGSTCVSGTCQVQAHWWQNKWIVAGLIALVLLVLALL